MHIILHGQKRRLYTKRYIQSFNLNTNRLIFEYWSHYCTITEHLREFHVYGTFKSRYNAAIKFKHQTPGSTAPASEFWEMHAFEVAKSIYCGTYSTDSGNILMNEILISFRRVNSTTAWMHSDILLNNPPRRIRTHRRAHSSEILNDRRVGLYSVSPLHNENGWIIFHGPLHNENRGKNAISFH